MLSITEEAKESVLDFSQRALKVFQTCSANMFVSSIHLFYYVY